MRILYGVQGTGNGHLSRGRAMARAFTAHPDVQIDWLFSGRERADFFDMECFGDWQWRRGLTFVTAAGRIRPLATVAQLPLRGFLRDVRTLDPRDYDVVISDFEPVTAWAARLRGCPCIGIGHQYALLPGVPRSQRHRVGSAVLASFAPVSTGVGLHWHHFGLPILPPIVDHDARAARAAPSPREALVYLPFEDADAVTALLHAIPDWHFTMFAPGLREETLDNVARHPVARAPFIAVLARASHVICNSGFELVSEALHLGRHVLARPLHGQMEQHSNALALEQLGLGRVAHRLDHATLTAFLATDAPAPRRHWPDVAAAIAAWVVARDESLAELATRLWLACDPRLARPAADCGPHKKRPAIVSPAFFANWSE